MARLKVAILVYALISVATIAIAAVWAVGAAQGAMSDCIDATCRITASDNGRGSGCVFEIGQGFVYVLTAGHVVGEDKTVKCEFWRDGHQSLPLAGQVIAKSKDADAAIVALPEDVFGGYLPAVVPVAPRDYVVKPGDTLTSVGCAKGTWSTGWKGHALNYNEGDLRFLPVPANGRSGSAVFDGEGRMIVGVLRARTVNDTEGIATPVQSLYEAFSFSVSDKSGSSRDKAEVISVQCAGGVCPIGSCAGGSCPNGKCPMQSSGGAQADRGTYVLPYRQKVNQDLDKIANTPYPTLPAPAAVTVPVPAAPRVDLDPILQAQRATNEQLSAIAAVLANKFNDRPAAQADSENKNLLERLKDKIEGKAENSQVEKFFDKFSDNGPGLFVIGVTVFLCIFLYKTVNNKPLLIEKAAPDSSAAQQAKEMRESLAEKINTMKSDLEAKLQSVKQDVTQVSNDVKTTNDAVSAADSAKTIAAEVAKSVAEVTQKS